MIIKRILQKAAVKTFPLWERLGLHVLPAHYYYPVPLSVDLPDELFKRVSACVGVDWRRSVQREYLTTVFAKYGNEVEIQANGGLSRVDAAVLHAMVRHHKPRKIVEIGSGHSTKVTAAACVLNRQGGRDTEFVAIEPYPSAVLRDGFDGLTRLRIEKVQQVELSEFEDCDLLFIDSSHVVSIGGDVTFIYLEILPRLKPGCLVHVHDILLPGHYWKEWVRRRRFYWTEQYLLQAFLMFNSEFNMLWAARLMQVEAPDALKATFPFHRDDDPVENVSSLWIQRRER